jgi:hypothetical protein
LIGQLDAILDPLGLDPDGLGESASALVQTLGEAIPSFRGLDLTVNYAGHPVTVTAFDQDALSSVATSLGWRLSRLPAVAPDRLILYAGRAGAFVDLAADLQYALAGRHPGASVDDNLELDRHLPPRTTDSGLTGLAELSLLNRAAGVLIDRGVDPPAALAELERRAGAAGLDRYSYAEQLLKPWTTPGPAPA